MNHTAQLSSRESLLSEMRLATSGMLSKIGNMPIFAQANMLGNEAIEMGMKMPNNINDNSVTQNLDFHSSSNLKM